jgi:hypothetical protein
VGRHQATPLLRPRSHGVKPFYYYHDAHCFAFASEIKAILALEHIPRRLNEVRIADYLLPDFEDTTSTLYQDIWRLPAHTLCASRKTLHTRRYWSLDPYYELPRQSDGEYAEAFRHCFRQAVAPRLRTAYAMGSTLSGGLDSSSNVVMAHDILRSESGVNWKRGCTPSRPFTTWRLRAMSGCSSRLFCSTCRDTLYKAQSMEAAIAQMKTTLVAPLFFPHSVHPDRLSPLTEWSRDSETDDEPL